MPQRKGNTSARSNLAELNFQKQALLTEEGVHAF